MSKPWWDMTAPEVFDAVENSGPYQFLKGWGKDRLGDVKKDLGIRDPNNKRDPITLGRDAAKRGDWDEFDAVSKNIDPNSLSPQEQAEFRGYNRSAKSAAEERELGKQDKTFKRLYGDDGYITRNMNRQFARDLAMNRENISAQKDIAGIASNTQISTANIGADASRDVANIGGQWSYAGTDRNAQASENIAAGQNATQMTLGMANNERMRDSAHLQHKSERSKMLLDTWMQGRAINASLYAPVGGYNSFA